MNLLWSPEAIEDLKSLRGGEPPIDLSGREVRAAPERAGFAEILDRL
jgi:hypothetical protein